jgi:molybdenum cofactor biosynthesis protein B
MAEKKTNSADEGGAGQAVSCLLVSVSPTGSGTPNEAARLAAERLGERGHRVVAHRRVEDERVAAQALLREIISQRSAQAVFFLGRTELRAHDSAFDGIDALLEKRLDGFAQLLRSLCFQKRKSGTMALRAAAGSIGRVILFCFPASIDAVEVAVGHLVAPELGALVAGLEARSTQGSP